MGATLPGGEAAQRQTESNTVRRTRIWAREVGKDGDATSWILSERKEVRTLCACHS